MNTPQDDGGPAFASPGMPAYSPDVAALNRWAGYGWAHDPQPGMSLRDYFAGMAMQGAIANPNCDDMAGQDVARSCYRLADEMLAARKEQP